MLVEVISAVDDSRGIVDATFLEMLIKNGTVTAFKRKHRWVLIDKHQIRQNNSGYNGPERRRIVQLSE